jgi:hypothetical protein
MSKQILPIKETYVSHWGLWEAVREIVQNAKDEEDARGNRMTVEHTGQYLVVANEDADMDRKVLLLGYTSKEGSNLRGHFGEGLNLALLAAARGGYDISVSTKTERWVPSIEESKHYGGERVLVISSTKHQTPRNGVTVKIKMTAELWAEMKLGFLFLYEDVTKVDTHQGAVLTNDSFRGKCFVKGIFTCNHPNTHYGYDFANVKVDRDRRMIDTWDLEWNMATMLRECLGKDPKAFAGNVLDMLETGASEAKSLKHNVSGPALDALVAEFQARNGEDALPVRSMAESREIEHFGRKTVVVPAAVAEVLEQKLGSFREVQAKLKKAVVKNYAWSDLTAEEQAVYTYAQELLLAAGVCSELPSVRVVDFNDPLIAGLASGTEMQLAKVCLADKYQYLATLIHEVAHMTTGAMDGEHAHVAAIEASWVKVMRHSAA